MGINTTGATPKASALLDVDASPGNNKGMLIPRMTGAERDAINMPAKGLMIYNTDCNTINYNAGTSASPNWVAVYSSNTVATPGYIAGPTSVCTNQTGVVFSIAAVGGANSYNWTVPAGATIATGQGATAITVNFGNTMDSVCVAAINNCGMGSARCITLTQNIKSADPVSASASPGSVCYGNSTTLTLTGGGGGTGETIQWYSGASCCSTSAGSGNNLSVSPTTTTTYYGRYEDGSPCNYNSGYASVQVTMNTLPTATAGTPISTCSNSGAVSITTGSDATNYSSVAWSTGGSGTFTNNTSLTTASYTPSAADITAGSATLTLTAIGNTGCSNATSNKTLTINPGPTANAGGALSAICQGGTSAALGGSVGGTATGGIWTDGGAGGSFPGGATNLNTTYAASFTGSSPVTLTLTSSGGSCGTTTASKQIVLNPAPAVSSASSGSICTGVALNYSITGGTTYNWGRAAVAGISNSAVTSQASNPITETLTNTTSSPVNVIYLITPTANGCTGAQFTYTVTVNSVPAAPTAYQNSSSSTQIEWIWSPVDVNGQWNTSPTYPGAGNNYNTGWFTPGFHSYPTYIQTGLTCGTAYSLYVWSFNGCGHSTATTLTQSTMCNCSGTISTFAGIDGSGCYAGTCGDGGSATSATLNFPGGLAVDAAGNIYIADTHTQRIRKVSSGTITNIAGKTNNADYTGDNGQATSATLNYPSSVAVTSNGSIIYIADQSNNVIRKVSGGIITTFAGGGSSGYAGEGQPATNTQFFSPQGIAVDASGNVYITDIGCCIRKVTSGGTITTVAGNSNVYSYNGDGIAATSAYLSSPTGLAVDASGNIYIAEYNGHRIRKVTASNGLISTIAGSTSGTAGYTGDGGSATSALINGPRAVAVDGSGNIYIADAGNYVIRKINSSGNICTYAGSQIWTGGYTGENVSSVTVTMSSSYGIAVDGSGNIYFSNGNRHTIRKVAP